MKSKIGLLGYFLSIFIGLNLLLGSFAIIINWEITGAIFVISLLISVVLLTVISWRAKENLRVIFSMLIIFLILIFGSIKVSSIYMDFSYDGQAYHQEAVIKLQEGWNPLYDEPLNEGYIGNFWVNHYAKANWFLGAILYDFTGDLESSKGFNFLILFSTILITYSYLFRLSSNRLISILIAGVAVCNPVTINQIYTSYNDGLMAILLLNLLVSYLSYYKNPSKIKLLNIFFIIMFVTNIKFTALGYTIILSAIPLLFMFNEYRLSKEKQVMKKWSIESKRLMVVIVSSFIISIFLVGSTSYVKNFLDHGHPFYPLAGEGKVDIITNNSPTGILQLNRAEKLYISLISETSNSLTEFPKPKFPLSITDNEKLFAGGIDTRIGGFGPLFGLVVLMSIGLFIFHAKTLVKRENLVYLVVIGTVFISVMINPEPWWARYIPQFWLIPLIILLLVFLKTNFASKIFVYIVIGIFIVNIGFTTSLNYKVLSTNQKQIDGQLKVLKEMSEQEAIIVDISAFRANRVILKENDIDYIEKQGNEQCEDVMNLTASYTTVCLPSDKAKE